MIRWGYIREIRPFNKSTPICLNRCFWAITSCPQRTRGIEILMGPDYGRRCRPVLMTDILPAKWPEKKKKKKKKMCRLACRTRQRRKKSGSLLHVCLFGQWLCSSSPACAFVKVFVQKHTLFFAHARIMEYLFKIRSSLFFLFFFLQRTKRK